MTIGYKYRFTLFSIMDLYMVDLAAASNTSMLQGYKASISTGHHQRQRLPFLPDLDRRYSRWKANVWENLNNARNGVRHF